MHDPVLVTNPARPRDHGSGFVIRRLDGDAGVQVLTCAHVVRSLGADGLRVGDQPAQVVIDLGTQGIDLAVLSVTGLTEPAPLELGRGTAGEEVELLGFEPAGGGPLSVPHRGRLAAASLTALAGRNRPAWHLELHDGNIEGGHSGGPVISVRTGKVVGVIAMGPDQQGGRDGVAVAIENLRVWKQAPTIAAARPPTDPGSLTQEMIPQPFWRRHWRWFAIGGLSVVAALGVAIALRPDPAPAPAPAPPCVVVPDLRDTFDAAPRAAWCPTGLPGEHTCRREFVDGGVVEGVCRDGVAVGDWSSLDPRKVKRWTARFEEPGRNPTAVFELITALTSGATDRLRISRGVKTAAGLVDSSYREVSCRSAAGFASVIRDQPDVAKPEVEVTLNVPDGVMVCSIVLADAAVPLALATLPEVQLCSIDEQQVEGTFARDTYRRLLSAELGVKSCNLPPLPPLAQCGDGKKSADEACDAGRETAACDGDCTLPACGDRRVNLAANEECDDGTQSTARCNANCKKPACGDGIVNRPAGEFCEPPRGQGALRNSASCDSDCTKPECGDDHLNIPSGEKCDPGEAGETATCNVNCTRRSCGDGITNRTAGESCDPPRAPTCSRACRDTRVVLPP